MTELYSKQYMQGIEVIKRDAKNKGFRFEFKNFPYRSPRDAEKQVAEARKWKMDAAIGPRFSGLFLMLQHLIEDIAVVSPLATAGAVYKMPSHFLTVAPPNAQAASAMVHFAKSRFPGRRIKPVVEGDCKYCIDWSEEFRRAATRVGLQVLETSKYLSNNYSTVDIEKVVTGTKETDLFLLPNRSLSSGALMGRITNYHKAPVIFLGADGWSDWSTGRTGKFKSEFHYKGYYVRSFNLEGTTDSMKNFHRKFRAIHGSPPEASVSYASYRAASVLLHKLVEAKPTQKLSQVLFTSMKGLSEADREALRVKDFSVYLVSQSRNEFVETLNPAHFLKPK